VAKEKWVKTAGHCCVSNFGMCVKFSFVTFPLTIGIESPLVCLLENKCSKSNETLNRNGGTAFPGLVEP